MQREPAVFLTKVLKKRPGEKGSFTDLEASRISLGIRTKYSRLSAIQPFLISQSKREPHPL